MTTYGRFPLHTSGFALALLAAAYASAQEPAAFSLLKSCGEVSEATTTIRGSDPVQIRYGFSTDAGTCYAVTATVGGQTVDGYLLRLEGGRESQHPAIAAFEQELRKHLPPTPVPDPPAPVPAASPTPAATAKIAASAASSATATVSQEAPAQAPEPLSFAGFRALDISGDRVDFSLSHTPTIVVYFWSASDRRGIQKAGEIENVYEKYHARGVDVIGVASAGSASQLRKVCNENEFVWPQIFDTGGIASRYHVDPAKPYLVLDQSRRVIATASSATDLDPVLKMLAQRRRLN
jgi:peroxiredoxin